MTKEKQYLLGAHMSIAGGLYKAIERGQSVGCTVIQLFTKSNRQWYSKPLEDVDIERFKQVFQASTIQTVFVHASYLINIGSNNPDLYLQSRTALAHEVDRCHQLGIPFLIIHPGAGLVPQETRLRIAQALDYIVENTSSSTTILLENTAGQGSAYGSSLEELQALYQAIQHKDRIGFCIDTCHAFVAGYDLRTPEPYKEFWQSFDRMLGMDRLKAIHLNDSKKGLHSRRDRHEHIGKGLLGLEAFSLLCNDPALQNVPKILETPQDNGLADVVMDMEVIKNLLD